MKKTVLLFLLVVVASSLKAQTFFHLQPLDSLAGNQDYSFKIKSFTFFNNLKPGDDFSKIIDAFQTSLKVNSFDNMPVIALSGNSKMGIIKPDGYYTMPVLKFSEAEPIQKGASILPGLPTFNKPK